MAVVMLKGMLYGAGREAECDLLAWHAPVGSILTYSQMCVIDAPLDLPDGSYTLVVESRVYSTEKRRGWWEMVHVERATA
jgi:hypothetical protein